MAVKCLEEGGAFSNSDKDLLWAIVNRRNGYF